MARLKTLLIITGLALVATYASAVLYDSATQPVAPAVKATAVQTPVETYSHDPYLANRMDALGLDYSELNLIRGANPALPTAQASFTGPNSLYIGNVREEIFDRVLMHEYLHYIQATDAEAVLLKPYMHELLASNPSFHERMEPYRNTPLCTGDCISYEFEAQAVACTELPDSQLRADFAAWCNKHLPLRLQ